MTRSRSEASTPVARVVDPIADLAGLIAATARRDRAAFERLYGLTSPKLLGIALRIVRDRAIAEDVVQDAFVKVWQGAGTYSAEAGRPMTWLITIARNRAIDIVRARRIAPTPVADEGDDWLAGVAEERDREAEFIDADRLSVCLGELDELHRRCFIDAYLSGYSREELAIRYDRPVNTIKTWLHRSANALRTCLGPL